MANCLSQHPDVSVFGETAFWGRRFVAPMDGVKLNPSQIEPVLRSLDNAKLLSSSAARAGSSHAQSPLTLTGSLESITRRPMTSGEMYLSILNCIADQASTNCVIEKTPHHINWVDRIVKHLPDARFIVMIREPYGFMRSYKHQGDRKPADVREAFERRYHPLACALIWRGYMRSARRVLSAYPERSLEVRFEDIQTNGEAVLEKTQRFLGLRILNLVLPSVNSSFPSGISDELTHGDIFAMNLCARRELLKSGFTPRPAMVAWSTKAAVLASFPLWAASNFLTMNRAVQGSRLRYLLHWLR
jgi:hypothetical protein